MRAHFRAGPTTGVLKAVAIPLYGFVRTRRLSGALLVALAANLLNQLDTRPGRALKAYITRAGEDQDRGHSRWSTVMRLGGATGATRE